MDSTNQDRRKLLELLDLSSEDCCDVDPLLDAHISHVDARIAKLSQLKEKLVELRLACLTEQSVDACGILRTLAVLEIAPWDSRPTHVG